MCDKETTKYSFDNVSLLKIINECLNEEVNFENYEEIDIDELEFGHPVYSPDMVFKGKDDIIIYEFLAMDEDPNDVLTNLFGCVVGLFVKFRVNVRVKLIVPPNFDEKLEIEVIADTFFKPQQLTLKNVDGDKLLSSMNDKVKNNKELTLNDFIKLSIVPLMKSENSLNEQVVEVIKTVEKMTNIDLLVREQILNMQLFIMDKFGDINSASQIMPVEGDDKRFLIVF